MSRICLSWPITRPLCHIKEGTDLLESRRVARSPAGPAVRLRLCRLSENFQSPSFSVTFILSSALKMQNLEQQITIERLFADTP